MSAILKANERKEFRNSSLKKLRSEGNIPAVIYGNKVASKSVYVNAADLIKTIRENGRNGVISLEVSGEKHNVILSQYQEDTLKKELLHADFRAVDLSSKINADVRLVLTGAAEGVKDGGVMQQPLHELSVTATPDKIPQVIEVDVSGLKVGESLTVADIMTFSNDYIINEEDSRVIASILPPKVEEEIDSGEEQEEGLPENEEGRETEAEEK